MLECPAGVAIAEAVAATGRQPHMMHDAIAEALGKKLVPNVVSKKVEGRGRVYR